MKLEKLLFCGLLAWGNPFAVSAQQLGGADFQPVSNSAVRSSFVRSDVSTAPVTSAKSPKIKEDFDFEVWSENPYNIFLDENDGIIKIKVEEQ